MLAVISPFMIPLAAGALGLEYLRRLLQPPAPNTTPVAAPFTPPFTGGQCNTNYSFSIIGIRRSTGATEVLDIRGIQGGIQSVSDSVNAQTGARRLEVVGANGTVATERPDSIWSKLSIADIARTDGLPDNCGNLPNPNPAPSIGSDGLASGGGVTASTGAPLVQGAPIVAIPSIAAIIAAISAAVKNAVNALDAIKDIMDAISAIGGILDAIKDWIDGQERDKPESKNLFKFDYGSIRKDGFLRLYPEGEVEGFEPVYVDLQLLSIPIGYGKYFGDLSPNFYRFKSLGYISFVSSSFGVLETREIEFSRASINVPSNAFGFFYHLGLEDVIRANVSLFYLQSVTTQEEN